jgi:hypothetical protein
MEKNKMSSYSKSKVSAFFGSHTDNQLRESIRQDVLIERYDDLQAEMSHLEDLLNISEEDFNNDLFAVNEMLFEMLETLVPELIEEDHSEELENDKEEIDEADEKAKRIASIKDREKAAISLAKDKENIIRAKSSMRSGEIEAKSASSPEAKKRARKTIAKARKSLTGIRKKD